MAQYTTKRAKITSRVKIVIDALLVAGIESKPKKQLIATISLDLGVKENEVLEVLETFANAGLVKINNEEVFVYGWYNFRRNKNIM